MNLSFCTFIFLAFIFDVIKADIGEACIDIDEKPGTCVNLQQCPKLLKMVEESKASIPEHTAAIAVIQKSTCGFLQMDPYVCCSNPDDKNEIYRIDSSSQNSQQSDLSVTSDAASDASSATKEDREVLPEDCGLVYTFKFFSGNRTELDDFPWTTLIEYDTPMGHRFACSGALISERYVLTAAHCVSGLQSSWKVIGVRFGEYDISTDVDCLPDEGSDEDCAEEPLNVAIEEIIAHSGFEPENPNRPHDIALLRLSEKVSFTDYIKPICLPLVQPIPQRYYTSGWGNGIARRGTAMKYMSYLTLDSSQSCNEKYSSEDVHITPYQICAGIQSSEKPCTGDEGGPLMGIEERPNHFNRVTAFGILSMIRPLDRACDYNGLPGVYTKVLDYMPWILNQLKE